MKINFQVSPKEWNNIKNKVMELSKDALSVGQVHVGDAVRLICFYFEHNKASKCFDGKVELDVETSGSWFFDKYSFFDADMKDNKFFQLDDNKILFITRAH